jgi:deoxyribodipyrimidine photo-lyase
LKVLPLFIFDKNILDKLEDKKDARVSFIHEQIRILSIQLKQFGSSIIVKYGDPETIWNELLDEYQITAVYTNRDYESYGIERDKSISTFLYNKGVNFQTFKDQVIFEQKEIVKKDGLPYTVFTPYSRRWKELLQSRTMGGELFYLKSYPTEKYFDNFYQTDTLPIPTLSEMGFEQSNIPIPSKEVAQGIIRNYDKNRNFPSVAGTSKLGIHFRFGTISIRQLVKQALPFPDKFLNELIWREFYQCILWHFPQVVHQSFKPAYDRIQWRNDPKEFEAWCQGKTGYPIVDAGMRELLNTGWMHNRVRMIVASFLTKHLLIDWRWGEAFFAEHLNDFELASNNGGWQWAAGCGVDAAPYFRIFNPALQTQKFDPQGKYIRQWVPEFDSLNYVQPIVDHTLARNRCLKAFQQALK